MKIAVARRIDYWLGVPVCFIFSFFYSISKLFNFKHGRSAVIPKKILFLELSEIGSAILAYPCMRAVQEKYPDASIYFWIFAKNKAVLDLLGIVPEENRVTVRDDSLFTFLTDIVKNIIFLLRERPDVVIDMELFSRVSSILSFLSRARTRVGFYPFNAQGLYRGDLHTHKVSYNPYFHISRNFLALAQALDADSSDMPLLKEQPSVYECSLPPLRMSLDKSRQRELGIADVLRYPRGKTIVINLGSNEAMDARKWPLAYYGALIKKLLAEPEVSVVLVGMGDKHSDFLEHKRCINLIGKTSLKDLIGLFNNSDVLVSHDSGMVHVASLTRIALIALFGPETPLLYGPLTENKKIFYKNLACSPCLSAFNHKNYVCRNNLCLQMISVEEVYTAVIQAFVVKEAHAL